MTAPDIAYSYATPADISTTSVATSVADSKAVSSGIVGSAADSKAVSSVARTLDTVPVPVGAVNFNDQQATSFRVENRTSDPVSPTVGQIWLRTDL